MTVTDHEAAASFAAPEKKSAQTIYCFQCLESYSIDDVRGRNAAGQEQPWSKVRIPTATPPARRGLRRRGNRRSEISDREKVKRISDGWEPFCPTGHALIDLEQAIIGVIGYSGASKSHLLAGMVRELTRDLTLQSVGIDVSFMEGHFADEMRSRVKTVYTEKKTLPGTERGTVFGPVPYGIESIATGRRKVLALFDVAGEDCTQRAFAARHMPFLPKAAGIVLVVDPGTLRDDVPEDRQVDRQVVDMLANLIRDLSGGRDPKESDLALVLTLAKADRLSLAGDEWPASVLPGLGAHGVETDRRRTIVEDLEDASEVARKIWIQQGGAGLIAAAIARFGKHNVRFAIVSALNEEPVDGELSNPCPVGCTVPLAQILRAQGML